MASSHRALFELKTMKAEDYFSKGIEADFVAALGRGDLRLAEQKLAQGASANAVGREGMTPLLWAMSKQSLAGFQFLLDHGADSNFISHWTDAQGQNESAGVIQMAAMLSSNDYLRVLLAHGGNPDQVVDSTGQTPIYTAILNQRQPNVEFLLMSGAHIDHRDFSGATPINYAVSTNRFALALYLLEHKADPKIEDRWGYSAIGTIKKFANRGVEVGSIDDKAYPVLVAELQRRGLW
jgi:ankyrin repeat protein